MLPFTKRSARLEDSEMINTGDVQVVSSARPLPAAMAPTVPAKSFPAPSTKPRVFSRSVTDDEMTTLLPRKGMTFSSRPPPPVTPVPMPKLASSRPPPRATLEEPPTRQFIRPSAPPPPSVSPIAGPPRASNRPAAKLAAQDERTTIKRDVSDKMKSDPPIDPPATVITARTRIVQARPTMSWAAALVAMGVFVGLVTAVVARGDADTLIDATASFVDPSGAHAAAAGVEVAAVQTKAEEPRTTFVQTVDTLLAATPVAALEGVNAVPQPPHPAPVAYAAPVHHAAWHPAPKPAVHAAPAASHEDRVAAAAPAPAPKASKHASEDDVESASAADALAKAQLEASLR